MSFWKKENEDDDEKTKVKVSALCPYCEGTIDKMIMKEIIATSPESNDDYEWDVTLYLCPHCKKIITANNNG